MATAAPPRPSVSPLNDRPHPSGDDRYALYALRGGSHRRLAETSREGIGVALITLREDEEYDDTDRIGVLDRQTRIWVVNPWARG